MQGSATRHSSRISMEFTVSLVSLGAASGVFGVATCTGGVSGGSICDESVNAASTIGFGSSEAAVVSVAVSLTDSAAFATSTLPIPALPIAVGCGASAKSAVRDGTRRSRVGAAVFSVPVEPKLARQATNAVSHNTAATDANSGFMIPSLQTLQLSQLAEPSMRRTDFWGHDMTTQWRQRSSSVFPNKCCPYATRGRKQFIGHFRTKRVEDSLLSPQKSSCRVQR